MSLSDLKGNSKVRERLVNVVKEGTISHAYILEGEAEIDKLQLANNFVKAILCNSKDGDCCDSCSSCIKINHGNHEDVIYYSAEESRIKDELIEELQSRIKKKPYMGSRNIVILQDVDTMTLRAQNRLLKTLEEPNPGTVIILLSENIENLTQTILSRCIIYRLHVDQLAENNTDFERVINFADMLLEKEPFHAIVQKIADYTMNRIAALEFLDGLESWFGDLAIIEFDEQGSLIRNSSYASTLATKSRLYKRADIIKAIQWIEEARKDINRNMNIGYTLKNMILKITV